MAEQRKQLRVKKEFQDRIIFDVILVIFILVNLLIVFSVFAVETVQDMGRLKMTLAAGLAIGEFGGLAVIYYLGLRTSHKIAGPVFALERRMDGLASGDLATRLQFRQGDHFKETADKLNSTVDVLRGKVSSIRDHVEALQSTLGQSAPLDGLIAELDFFSLAGEHSFGNEQERHQQSDPVSVSLAPETNLTEGEQAQPAPVSPKI